MIREVTFPLHTQSENAYRGLAFAVANAPPHKQRAIAHAAASKTKKQRGDVKLFLDSSFPRPLQWLGAEPNTFEATLTRISPGTLDDDNLRGALKGVRDEVAAWVELDDRDQRLRFSYLQQLCSAGYQGVRITIADDDGRRDVRRIIGATPRLIGDPEACPSRGRPGAVRGVAARRAPPPSQIMLPGLKAFAVLPWDQHGTEEAVLTPLPSMSVADPPLELRYRYPGRKDTVTLRRGRVELPELGACWLYEVAT